MVHREIRFDHPSTLPPIGSITQLNALGLTQLNALGLTQLNALGLLVLLAFAGRNTAL
jgi:hypothetical protein